MYTYRSLINLPQKQFEMGDCGSIPILTLFGAAGCEKQAENMKLSMLSLIMHHKLQSLGSQCPQHDPKAGADKNNLSGTVRDHLPFRQLQPPL